MKYINILIFLLISISWNNSYGETTFENDTIQYIEQEYQEECSKPEIQEQEEQTVNNETQATEPKSQTTEETYDKPSFVEVAIDLVLTGLLMGCK